VLHGAVELLESHGISVASCLDQDELESRIDDVRTALASLERLLTFDRERWAPHMNPSGTVDPILTSKMTRDAVLRPYRSLCDVDG
jgi:hypothetical protein